MSHTQRNIAWTASEPPKHDVAARLRPAPQAVAERRLPATARAQGPTLVGIEAARELRAQRALQRGQRHAVHADQGLQRGHAGGRRRGADGAAQLALRSVDLPGRRQARQDGRASNGQNLDLYVWVLNILDRDNVNTVYTSTGSATTTNFLNTARRSGLPGDQRGRPTARTGAPALPAGRAQPHAARNPAPGAFRRPAELLATSAEAKEGLMMRTLRWVGVATLLLVLAAPDARWARRGRDCQHKAAKSTARRRCAPAPAAIIDNDNHIDVNNLDMFVTNHGSLGLRPRTPATRVSSTRRGAPTPRCSPPGSGSAPRWTARSGPRSASTRRSSGPGRWPAGPSSPTRRSSATTGSTGGTRPARDYLNWPVEPGSAARLPRQPAPPRGRHHLERLQRRRSGRPHQRRRAHRAAGDRGPADDVRLQPLGPAREHHLRQVEDHQQGREPARQHVRLGLERPGPRRLHGRPGRLRHHAERWASATTPPTRTSCTAPTPPAVGYDFFRGPIASTVWASPSTRWA